MVACAVATATSATNFPSLEDAQELFRPYLPCCQKQLRRVYLRLALQYHPDKCLGNLKEATELFQAIAAVHEQLSKAEDGIQRRVKSQVAAAAELGEIEELERLLLEDPQRSVEVDDLGVCPLMFAAAGGHLDAIRLLLFYGADVNAKNPIHWTVMLYACLGNHADVVRWLGRTAGVKVTAHELVLTAYTGNSQALASLIELYEEKWDGCGEGFPACSDFQQLIFNTNSSSDSQSFQITARHERKQSLEVLIRIVLCIMCLTTSRACFLLSAFFIFQSHRSHAPLQPFKHR